MKSCCADRKHTCRMVVSVAGLTCALLSNAAAAESHALAAAETMFRGALSAVLDNRPEAALTIATDALALKSDFRITEILRADLLAAYAHQKPLMAMPQMLRQWRVVGLKDEMLVRFTHRPPAANLLPQGILQLSSRHRFALVLDAAHARLYVFRNVQGRPLLIDDYYASIGHGGMHKRTEGDNRTPTGIYRTVTFLADTALPELYGMGAYTLDYPNQSDKRLGYSGYGIWVHGMPRALGSRPPRDSRGCIILENAAMVAVRQYVGDAAKTPALLSPKVVWQNEQAWQAQRSQLLQRIRGWQQAWEGMDTEHYLGYYDSEYVDATQNYQQMVAQTRINARKKTFVKVTIDALDMFVHPGQPDLVQMVFDQDYQSNNYSIRYRKQQLWRHTDSGWHIVYEGRFD